jgi:hypothetical protein
MSATATPVNKRRTAEVQRAQAAHGASGRSRRHHGTEAATTKGGPQAWKVLKAQRGREHRRPSPRTNAKPISRRLTPPRLANDQTVQTAGQKRLNAVNSQASTRLINNHGSIDLPMRSGGGAPGRSARRASRKYGSMNRSASDNKDPRPEAEVLGRPPRGGR